MRNDGLQIRVGDVLHAIYKHRLMILALTCAGLMLGIILSGISYLRGEMSKQYVITSAIAVATQTQNGLFTSGYNVPNSNDIYLAQNLADSAMFVLRSDKILDNVINNLNLLGITTKDIYNNLSLSQYNSTQIIEVSLYWRSADEGIAILKAINAVAPQVLIETLNVGGVTIVNEPSARYLIGGSLNAALWGYMSVFGLLIGVGIAVLELLMRPTLLNTKDVEDIYDLEVFAEVPENKAYFKRTGSILVNDDATAEITENFASAAHIIRNRLGRKEKHHIFFVTSASRNEGKTTTAANLAIQLSDLEQHVLLIDLDTRNPSLGGLFLEKVDYNHSLNALYRGEISEREAISTLTGYLDLLPVVLERKNVPLDSTVFELVNRLAQHYDYTIIDTAPVGLAANTMSLSQIATNALFVVRYDTASIQEIREALDRLDKSGIRVFGSIVNGVQYVAPGNRVKIAYRAEEPVTSSEGNAADNTAEADNTEIPLTHEQETTYAQIIWADQKPTEDADSAARTEEDFVSGLTEQPENADEAQQKAEQRSNEELGAMLTPPEPETQEAAEAADETPADAQHTNEASEAADEGAPEETDGTADEADEAAEEYQPEGFITWSAFKAMAEQEDKRDRVDGEDA